MTAAQSVETTIAQELHSLLFFEEFTFARNKFSPPSGSELELADAVVMLGETLLIYQIKERSSADAGDAEAERRWFDSAVRKKGLRQIRDTINHLQSFSQINVANERGRVFNLAAERFTNILKLLVYHPSANLPEDCRTKRCHDSSTAGFIHIVTAHDYLQIARTLRVPAEMIEYFQYRETVLQRYPDDHGMLPDAVMVGHFINGDRNSMPTRASIQHLRELIDDSEKWDLSGLLRNIHNHQIEPGYSDNYYQILIEFAKLPRSMWSAAKERIMLCLEKAKEEKLTRPYRFSYRATNTGFVFVPVPTSISQQADWQANKTSALIRFTEAHKYDQKLEKCVGVSVSWDGKFFDVFWCLISCAWEEDQELQKLLKDNFPFRPVKEELVSGYQFHKAD